MTLPAVAETPTAKSVTTLDKARPQKTSRGFPHDFVEFLACKKMAGISSKTGAWTMIRMMKTMVAALKPAWELRVSDEERRNPTNPERIHNASRGNAQPLLVWARACSLIPQVDSSHFLLRCLPQNHINKKST